MSRPTRPSPEPEEIEAELAAALPAARVRTISRQALHVVPFILLAAAVYVLWREFRELSLAEVVHAIRAWGHGAILAALALSALSFLFMGAIEWLGLRWSGAKVPWVAVLSGSFLANAIAHSLGANLLVSGAIRTRLYSRYGVGLRQVAATTLFGGVSFGVGLSALAGAGLLFSSPQNLAAVAIPHPLARIVGALLVTGALGYVLLCAVRRKPLTAFGHSLRLPSLDQAAAQLVVGFVDNAMAAAIIWSLLPPGTVSFLSFVSAYAIAVTAGLVSSVPGGAGVFEGSLSALVHSAGPAPLAAAFLGYRLSYYLLPLMIGVLALAGDTLGRRGGEAA